MGGLAGCCGWGVSSSFGVVVEKSGRGRSEARWTARSHCRVQFLPVRLQFEHGPRAVMSSEFPPAGQQVMSHRLSKCVRRRLRLTRLLRKGNVAGALALAALVATAVLAAAGLEACLHRRRLLVVLRRGRREVAHGLRMGHDVGVGMRRVTW